MSERNISTTQNVHRGHTSLSLAPFIRGKVKEYMSANTCSKTGVASCSIPVNFLILFLELRHFQAVARHWN